MTQGIVGKKDFTFRDHQGTLLYTGAIDKDVPVSAAIAIVRLEGVTPDKLYRYHAHGDFAHIIESLAQFFISNPGLTEAVTGMIQGLRGQALLEVQQRQQQQGGQR